MEILPAAQRRLWPELAETPGEFTLYGGTAIALRLAHRQSVDFDFFTLASFEPNALLRKIPYLRDAVPRQASTNTLSATVDRGGVVQLSYFGGLGIGQVASDEIAEGAGFRVASLIDLAGMKAAVLPQRVELRDYLDIHALLTKGGIPLAEMLAAARVIYGVQFNPLLTLKALAYHEDLALAELPKSARDDLSAAATAIDFRSLPTLIAFRERANS
ncbi:MAG TPA: nucleotidyl transferase AbiEii/AbiGii toxin family protein [Xanthobacteraceae bacterium]|nr:nucleotidyl transferase AbiEii/AbiGii toxin family protein [Xanthobacteraceae bacterium]